MTGIFSGTPLLAALALLLAACGRAASPPPPSRPALQALLAEKKFERTAYYTGVDAPEDRKPLEDAVNGAVKDIEALPDPIDRSEVRRRLSKLIADTSAFATEDRDEVYRYAVRTWRAAGFRERSGLFAVPDEKVLERP